MENEDGEWRMEYEDGEWRPRFPPVREVRGCILVVWPLFLRKKKKGFCTVRQQGGDLAHGQRGNKSRVGLAGAGMESGRFAHGQRGGKSRAVFRAQGWREHRESRVGLACACAWTEGCSGRMRMGRGIANRGS